MKKELLNFISSKAFPCVMAKAVAKNGNLVVHKAGHLLSLESRSLFFKTIYSFIDHLREHPKKLHSFVYVLEGEEYEDFETCENSFWSFLKLIHEEDKKLFPHDERVASSPDHPDFSFSIKSEAFFILMLHPQSPRLARRFFKPAIVFNPHRQFEELRKKGVFENVRNIIRLRDKMLQGYINPMLSDYGEQTEVFQYTGRQYAPNSLNPLMM